MRKLIHVLIIACLVLPFFPTRALAAADEKDDFVFTILTYNSGLTFTIPTTGAGYDYSVDCDNDLNFETTTATGDYTCHYTEVGEHTIRVRANGVNGEGFPRIYEYKKNYSDDPQIIKYIDQWGHIAWISMDGAFADIHRNFMELTIRATDTPFLTNVTSMSRMFEGRTLSETDLSFWDVSKIQDMSRMFYGSEFTDANISNWDTSNVTNMSEMFSRTYQLKVDISNWRVHNVTDMSGMLASAYFDFDITRWDTSNVLNMSEMLAFTGDFNQDISGWDTSKVTNFNNFLRGASSFNQDLGSLDLSSAEDITGMLDATDLSEENYALTLAGWLANPTTPHNLTLGALGLGYCDSQSRSDLISTKSWQIKNDVDTCPFVSNDGSFIFTVGSLLPSEYTFEIYTGDGDYDFNVDCDNDGVIDSYHNTSDYTCVYPESGVHTIRIVDGTGTNDGFPMIANYDPPQWSQYGFDLYYIHQWGANKWESMAYAFQDTWRLKIIANDTPDLSECPFMWHMFEGSGITNEDFSAWDTSNVTEMSGLFKWSTYNGDISTWDTGNVIDMSWMFEGNREFNQDISKWDTSNVTGMEWMFSGASEFNSDISRWNTSKITSMQSMFGGANKFNADISNWDTSSVKYMEWMFAGATTFNQPIGKWNTKNVESIFMMLLGAEAFDQDLSNWNVQKVSNAQYFWIHDVNISTINYDKLLISWAAQNVQKNVKFDIDAQYCLGGDARENLIDNYGWEIHDKGKTTCSYTFSDLNELTLPDSGFAPNRIASDLDTETDRPITNQQTTFTLNIPSIQVNASIVGIPFNSVSWDISWLGEDVGWLNNTAYPTWNGNTVLTGHVWDADNTPGIFYNIRNLSVGDSFEITNQGRRYIYEVRENKTFMVWDDPSNILVHKENDWVTLLTCEDYSENTDSYLKRRVVIGELVRIE